MKKTKDNIMALQRIGVQLVIKSDDFQFSELAEFARLSCSNETNLTIAVGDDLSFDEIMQLARASHGHLIVDLSRV